MRADGPRYPIPNTHDGLTWPNRQRHQDNAETDYDGEPMDVDPWQA